jgi:hypothetical protein
MIVYCSKGMSVKLMKMVKGTLTHFLGTDGVVAAFINLSSLQNTLC